MNKTRKKQSHVAVWMLLPIAIWSWPASTVAADYPDVLFWLTQKRACAEPQIRILCGANGPRGRAKWTQNVVS